jgi:DNA-binding CsgD family transcriptional regulator
LKGDFMLRMRHFKYEKMKVAKKSVWIFIAVLLVAMMIIPAHAFATEQTRAGVVSTRAEFTRALGDKQSVIYVDDIDFGVGSEQIEITYDVTIIGKESGSVLRGGYFKIRSDEIQEELFTVRFENIVFDGGYDTDSIVFPKEGRGFGELFGGRRDEFRCIHAEAYVDLSFLNCEFTRYVSSYGPVYCNYYVNVNEELQRQTVLRMEKCRVYGNISEKNSIQMTGEGSTARLTNCKFFDNTARSTAGARFSQITVEIIDCTIEKNHYYSYYPNEEDNYSRAFYGGGLSISDSDLWLIGTVIRNNHADCGGGIMLVNSNAWIEDCRITANTAEEDGGGIHIITSEECPTYITNTYIVQNHAERGGALSTTLLDTLNREIPAGIVEFSFCTIGFNEANDGSDFAYNDTTTVTMKRGTIDLLGCFVLEASLPHQLAQAPDYNYINSVDDALRKDAVPRIHISTPATMGVRPTPGGEADVTVPAYAMKLWANGAYADITTGRKIGWNGIIVEVEPVNLGGVNPLVLIIPAAILLCAIGATILFIKHRKKRLASGVVQTEPGSEAKRAKGEVSPEIPIPEIPQYVIERLDSFMQNIETLSVAERRVFDCYIQGCTPKEAENQLVLAESTIKTHNKRIYTKLDVDDYKEMMLFIKLMKGCGK